MGFGTLAQFALGFGQRDVQASLAALGAVLEKVQGYGGFAGPWLTFEQEQMAARQSAGKDVVKTDNTGGCFVT